VRPAAPAPEGRLYSLGPVVPRGLNVSKKLVLAAVGVLVLVAGAAVAYAYDVGALTVVLLGLVAGLAALSALDANQRVRQQHRQVVRWQKSAQERLAAVEDELLRRGARVEAATQDDVLGTVKLLQEQYVGRLDRAQAELEQAAAALRAVTGTARAE